MSGPGYALEPGEAEAYEREQERADSPREPRACPFCTGSGSHCPECSDDDNEETMNTNDHPTAPVQSEASTPALPSCPYCSKPMDAPVTHRIIDRGWNPVQRKQYVRERQMQFCSDQCGGNYQMGCEG